MKMIRILLTITLAAIIILGLIVLPIAHDTLAKSKRTKRLEQKSRKIVSDLETKLDSEYAINAARFGLVKNITSTELPNDTLAQIGHNLKEKSLQFIREHS